LEIAEQNSTLIIDCKLFETSKKNALKNLNILIVHSFRVIRSPNLDMTQKYLKLNLKYLELNLKYLN